MGAIDKMRNAAAKMLGKTKQRTGEATGDPRLQFEGRAEQGRAGLKQTGERIKDTGRDAKDTFGE